MIGALPAGVTFGKVFAPFSVIAPVVDFDAFANANPGGVVFVIGLFLQRQLPLE